MWRVKWSRLAECLTRPQGLVLLLLPGLIGFSLYFLSGTQNYYDRFRFDYYKNSVELMDGYLVWNPKCHMLSMNPYAPSIIQIVKNEEYESCSQGPTLTSITKDLKGNIYLTINREVAKQYKGLSCCWASISRPSVGNKIIVDDAVDSTIKVGKCQNFKDRAFLPKSVETLQVTCRVKKTKSTNKGKKAKASYELVYENVHAVLNPKRMDGRLTVSKNIEITDKPPSENERPLSVLMLGLDSISRLNFQRTMPFTRGFLEYKGWTELRGYNKMGDNTFPNVMAILTGQNETTALDKCNPDVLYGLDNCQMMWYNFRNSGYVTAFAEDDVSIGTFNYFKVGFVKPPTDYYLRPYALASERLLKIKKRFATNYCTGPELSVDRIFDYGVQFAKTFIGSPYFGFFWTNSISHNDVNGPSLYDTRFMAKLQDMESAGVMNDSMIILLSDHGMRFGEIRSTFVGWYEDRLPFIYIWLPEWYRKQYPEAHDALRINQNRLTSPYDLYETLRDILSKAGGQAPPSTGCPGCQTLFKPVPYERGCKDAGITSHWCTCVEFEPASTTDSIVVEGAYKFVEHMNNIIRVFKNSDGTRLCASLELKRIIRVKKLLDFDQDPNTPVLKLLYLIETYPGDAMFESTISYHGPGNYTIVTEEISRITIYFYSAKCLNDDLYKRFCHCIDSTDQ